MIEKIKACLMQGKYMEVEEICNNIQLSDIKDILMNIAYDTESICVYSFIQYMIQKTEKEEWIKIAIEIMSNPLSYIEGAYSVALFHAREILSAKKSVDNLERILFFYNIPEKLINEEEALCIAEEILDIEPKNKIAHSVKY